MMTIGPIVGSMEKLHFIEIQSIRKYKIILFFNRNTTFSAYPFDWFHMTANWPKLFCRIYEHRDTVCWYYADAICVLFIDDADS
jgi:hypothetical protein